MKPATPYRAELLRVARKVVWYDAPQRTLGDTPTFPAHPMEYGSSADVTVRTRDESMAGRQGFEPRYADPESAVLPLDDLPTVIVF